LGLKSHWLKGKNGAERALGLKFTMEQAAVGIVILFSPLVCVQSPSKPSISHCKNVAGLRVGESCDRMNARDIDSFSLVEILIQVSHCTSDTSLGNHFESFATCIRK
jgi:hypothetical protein